MTFWWCVLKLHSSCSVDCDYRCYPATYLACGRHMLRGRLQPSSLDAAEGAVEELERIVGRIRESSPQVRVIAPGGREVLPGGADGVVQGARGSGLRARTGAEPTSKATMRANQLRLHRAELAQAQFGTIRPQLLKVAAQVQVSVRRIRVSLSPLVPLQALFAQCMARLRAALAARIAPVPRGVIQAKNRFGSAARGWPRGYLYP